MADMTVERFNEIGCQVLISQIFRDYTLYRLVTLSEKDIKKKVGQIAQEMEGMTDDVLKLVSRDELLQFVKFLMSAVCEMVNRTNERTQQIEFR